MLILGPLYGYKVIEFAEGVAGPYCCMELADAGADVVKIEPIHGDKSRKWGGAELGGESTAFLSLNRNKKSIALDPSTDEGLKIINRLMESADVVVVDETHSSQLNYDKVSQLNSKVIYCSISGYGDRGPWSDWKGGELPVQLMCEATLSLGKINESPVRLGTPIANMYAALYSVQAICAALWEQGESGIGQFIDVSLFGSVLAMRSTLWVALSNPDEWWGFHLDNYVKPSFRGYRCKDMFIYFQIRNIENINVDELLRDLEMTWAKDDPLYPLLIKDIAGNTGRYSHVVQHLWERGFAKFLGKEVMKIIEDHGGVAYPVNDYSSLTEDEQVKHLGIFNSVKWSDFSGVIEITPPWKFSATPVECSFAPPHLGQHSEEILKGLGLNENEIFDLIKSQVVRN